MCREVIIFRFNCKTQWQMFLLLYSRHVGASWRLHTKLYKFGWSTFPKNRIDPDHASCLYIISYLSYTRFLKAAECLTLLFLIAWHIIQQWLCILDLMLRKIKRLSCRLRFRKAPFSPILKRRSSVFRFLWLSLKSVFKDLRFRDR